ncbi:MAG: hypothetical protein ACYSU7_14455 [Planctomycetota bacterium]
MMCFARALPASADAIVVTRAMTASTIAEVFVEPDAVRIKLEIGLADLAAFRNLLPDDLYERMGREPEPQADRLARYFREDFVLRPDDGDPLRGEVRQFAARRRIVRDEITGEPLPSDDDDDDREVIIYAELFCPLEGRPATLTLRPPLADSGFAAANIGFVTYHEGLAVNDFRYLGAEETLDLDWDDPWFSQFRNRNLRRQYTAPIQAFLYVDPFEVRQEIIARPKDLQQWIDLGLDGRDVIPAAEQGAIKEKVAAFLARRNPVTIDGVRREPVLDRIHFVRRTLRTTGVVDPPEDLPVVSATLGVIFVFPITELPQEAAMEWQLFSDRIQQVPMVATDEAGGLPFTITPDDPVLRWQNFLVNPTIPTLVALAPPPPPRRIRIPMLSVVCFGVFAWLAFSALRAPSRKSWPVPLGGILLIAAGVLLSPFAQVTIRNPLAGPTAVTDADARVIVTGLLKNVYRAFDFREEGVIYDTLERSASGELLTKIYLETRRALELKNQGGARAKVADVEMLGTETTNLRDGVGFETQCTWNVAGSVGHWGHIHQRRNQYEAVLTVKPVDGVWKVTALELLSEERL